MNGLTCYTSDAGMSNLSHGAARCCGNPTAIAFWPQLGSSIGFVRDECASRRRRPVRRHEALPVQGMHELKRR